MKILFLPHLVIVACLIVTASSYEIDPSLKFSQAIDTIPIGRHFENRTVYHPLYLGVGLGTLPLDQFKAMTQQGDLYVRNFFAVFRTIAARESDPERKAFLTTIGSDNWESYFQIFYDKFNFTAPKYMVPRVTEYTAYQIHAAKHWDLGAALASAVPCYTVWAKMGAVINEIADLPNNPNHPYKEFIEANAPSKEAQSLLSEFLDFVDGYYERLGLDNQKQRQQMFDAYLKSVEHEFFYAETNMVLHPESNPPPQFSELIEHVNEEMQLEVIRHRLYSKMATGTLPLDAFKVLIQQDHIYLRGFYKAFQIMEEKETDPELKALLRNDGTEHYAFFAQLYKDYNFGEAGATESYTSGYVDSMIAVAEHSTVAEGLAAVYPCYFLWYHMGVYINDIADLPNSPDHPYYSFVLSQDPTNSTSLTRFNLLINGYFSRLDSMDVEMHHNMYQTVHKSVLHEYMFATEIYERSLLSTRY